MATWRTGSSFVGNILRSNPKVYFHYEPLAQYGLNLSYELEPALAHLKKLFLCDFSNMDEYLKLFNEQSWLLQYNRQMLPFRNASIDFSRDINFLSFACSVFPIQVIKTVRLSLRASEPLLNDPDLDLKIILLVRDPRSVFSSRSNTDWCTLKNKVCYLAYYYSVFVMTFNWLLN